MNELALFAGAGGGILGGLLLGWKTVCAVEFDPHARNVLVARQNDGCLEPFPIWDDVSTFDGKPWRGVVDVVSGGFPCQDISAAGNGEGIKGDQSSLWGEMRRIIGDVRPKYTIIENSPMLTIRGGSRVVANLASMGYFGQHGVLGASHAGYDHNRERMWIVAYNSEERRSRWTNKETNRCGGNSRGVQSSVLQTQAIREFTKVYRESGTKLGRVADGVASDVDRRLARIGNGQVPAVVKLAWEILTNEA